jgi:hypothetical protein
MSQPRDDRQDDLFRPPLKDIINLRHPLVQLAGEIDWDFLGRRFASACCAGPGHPPLPTRLVAGLFILKHMHNLSDELLCDRWVENPYFQYFCGEVVFRHELPFDRSSLTRWRQRLGEEQLAALLQESLAVAHRTGTTETKDLEPVVVDTTSPYDGHTIVPVIADLERRTGVAVRRSHGDKGYRGHNHPDRFKVWITGQVRRVTKAIRREMRRRAAVEPVIGHLKADPRSLHARKAGKGRDLGPIVAFIRASRRLLRRVAPTRQILADTANRQPHTKRARINSRTTGRAQSANGSCN